MLNLVLDNPPLQARTLEEALPIIKTLWQFMGELNSPVEHLEEYLGGCSGNSSRLPSQSSLKQRVKPKKNPPSHRQHCTQPGYKKNQGAMLPEDQFNHS